MIEYVLTVSLPPALLCEQSILNKQELNKLLLVPEQVMEQTPIMAWHQPVLLAVQACGTGRIHARLLA